VTSSWFFILQLSQATRSNKYQMEKYFTAGQATDNMVHAHCMLDT